MDVSDLLQNVHFINDMFVCIYPYIIPTAYDVYFVAFAFITVLSWIVFKNECILSYYEKKMENPDYEMGSDPAYNPYHKRFYYYNGVNYAFIKEFFWVLTFLILLFFRKNGRFVKYGLVVMLLLVCYVKIPILIRNGGVLNK